MKEVYGVDNWGFKNWQVRSVCFLLSHVSPLNSSWQKHSNPGWRRTVWQVPYFYMELFYRSPLFLSLCPGKQHQACSESTLNPPVAKSCWARKFCREWSSWSCNRAGQRHILRRMIRSVSRILTCKCSWRGRGQKLIRLSDSYHGYSRMSSPWNTVRDGFLWEVWATSLCA